MLSTSRFLICTVIVVNLFSRSKASYLNETDSVEEESLDVSIDVDSPESQSILKNIGKAALRYGFQRTKDCQNFAKAFICVRKCLDLNYDAAHSNKTCHCTCFRVLDLHGHKIPTGRPRDTYKKGYPTTIKPYWIQGLVNPDTDIPEDDSDGSGSGSDEGSTSAGGKSKGGKGGKTTKATSKGTSKGGSKGNSKGSSKEASKETTKAASKEAAKTVTTPAAKKKT